MGLAVEGESFKVIFADPIITIKVGDIVIELSGVPEVFRIGSDVIKPFLSHIPAKQRLLVHFKEYDPLILTVLISGVLLTNFGCFLAPIGDHNQVTVGKGLGFEAIKCSTEFFFSIACAPFVFTEIHGHDDANENTSFLLFLPRKFHRRTFDMVSPNSSLGGLDDLVYVFPPI